MAADAGLSIKERLAMLQASNKNPQLSGPMKAAPQGPHKTAVAINKPTPAEQNNKPNGPATPAKPFGALKPSKPATNDAGDAKDTPQLAFKLRPTGAQVDGKGVTPVTPNNLNASNTGGTGIMPPASAKFNSPAGTGGTPAVAKKPNDSHVAPLVPKKPGGSFQEPVSTTSVATKDESDNAITPRPLSIKDRMAALKRKSLGEDSVSTPASSNTDPKSPESAQKKFPVFPQKAGIAGQPIKPLDLAKSIQEAAKRKKASDTFLRHSDGKRFHKINAASVVASGPAPAKPAQIDNVDLATFLQTYAKAKESKLSTDAAKSDAADAADGEMDELYVEAESTSVQLRVRGRGSVKRAASVRVSEIPEFTEEEEQQELFIDSLSAQESAAKIPEAPEEEYDDCASAAAAVTQTQNKRQSEVFEEPDEIYEPLDEEMDFPPPESVPSPGPADDKKAKKEKEKEKEKEKDGKGAKKKDKAKEEANKKEEKERKKREEEIKKQRSKFGLKDTDEKVGDGVVKSSASAGVFTKDLAATKGEIVTILRMDNNPAGKWLVMNEQGKLGFVSSNNIEVATPSIRQMMSSAATDSHGDDGDPEELYEALPEGEMDEIYEEL